MPFAVELCFDAEGVAWDAPEIYKGCDTVIDVLTRLGSEWVAGDLELPHTFTFLAAHGRDFGITDDEVDEGTDEALLARAVETVLELCADNEEVTREYLAVIGSRVRIVEADERSEATDDDEDEDETDDDPV
jgi:hypothetical protein